MNEGAALRVLSFLSDSNQQHITALANEKCKVSVIGEEHEPDEYLQEESVIPVTDEEIDLPPEVVKAFFKAAHDGSIDRLEELFDATSNTAANMTYFTESLLMTAIRNKRNKTAEYLIDQLGVNVNHTTNLLEFRINSKIPVREEAVSCRDLAYSRGMMDLVDLIDLSSEEVKPSIKRYIKRRLRSRLDQIHQNYLRRMKERNHRFTLQMQEKEKQINEEDEIDKDSDEPPSAQSTENNDKNQFQLPPPPIVPRQYKSHIEAKIQDLDSKNDKPIDETGKKLFRFSGYTLHYRLVETEGQKSAKQEKPRPKTAAVPFSTIPTISTHSFIPSPVLRSRPMTTAATPNINLRSSSEITARIPIRETRTSICRSALRTVTPRAPSTIHLANKPEIISTTIAAAAATTTTTTTTTTAMKATPIKSVQRLLPKRISQINSRYTCIPQIQQSALYNDPRRFLPVTLKTTATGILSDIRLMRE